MADVIVCFTKCWACQFGAHDPEWHPWADAEDIDHAAKTGQPNPSGQRCGCYCCRDAERPNPPAQPTQPGTTP